MNTHTNTVGKREVDWLRVPVWEVSPDGYVGGFTTRPWMEIRNQGIAKRLIFLNAIVPSTSEGFIYMEPIRPELLKEFLKELGTVPYESFIGHSGTAALLTKMLGMNIIVNRGEYTPQCGDVA
ncbi:MAG: STIV orfB116 family protein, partial [Conexivisphaera sp.]